jgi:hypothetical protein
MNTSFIEKYGNGKAIWINFFNNVYNTEEDKIQHILNPSKLTLFLLFISTYW